MSPAILIDDLFELQPEILVADIEQFAQEGGIEVGADLFRLNQQIVYDAVVHQHSSFPIVDGAPGRDDLLDVHSLPQRGFLITAHTQYLKEKQTQDQHQRDGGEEDADVITAVLCEIGHAVKKIRVHKCRPLCYPDLNTYSRGVDTRRPCLSALYILVQLLLRGTETKDIRYLKIVTGIHAMIVGEFGKLKLALFKTELLT